MKETGQLMKKMPAQGNGYEGRQLISLRTKFVLFISLIIIGVCSGLSWFFIQQQAEFMERSLIKIGTTLVDHLAHTSRYSLIAEDQIVLEQLMGAELTVEELVYVVMTGPKGERLGAKSKGMLTDAEQLRRSPDAPLYPDVSLARKALSSITSEPLVTPFTVTDQRVEARQPRKEGESHPVLITTEGETLYDFALPVRRLTRPMQLLGEVLPFVSEERFQKELITEFPAEVVGLVQIGLTKAQMLQALNTVVWNIALITILIIAIGIAGTIMLANRIITPIRSLATVARQVAEGDLTVSVEPTTRDEVGQLTGIFNQMTRSLSERSQAILSQMETITMQVKQLTTLNQTGAAITSTLDLDKLLTTVLHLLVENVGFNRMLLMLYDSERGIAFGSQIAGIPGDIAMAVRNYEMLVQDDQSLQAELLIRGKSILLSDMAMVAGRVDPALFELAQRLDVTSVVCAPLKSQQGILGFVAADRGPQPCTQEDLDLLMTIANNIGVAIDNARAYNQLEQLTETLEQRVQERTQELQNANEKLLELDRLKSAFVSIVSHELRTPMTSIKGLVENMLDGLTGGLTERQGFYLDRVKHNIERLTRMINDLLDLSRIEAGRMELNPTSVSVLELANEVVESLRQNAEGKSISLEIHTQGELPLIQGDRDTLNQVFTNLIHNGIKFTQPGGRVNVELLVRKDQKTKVVQICVVDTGCGIPPNDLAKIFEGFYRSQSAPVEARGAGLGLAITKSLVELHGGQIWAESTPGEGSRFFVTLPIPTATSQ